MLRNSRGQIAVFVALIFQVLFVFFAMTINIGLLIHDKINLQNSVDLAAYYAASKQAEVLNAIAHTNYQIRQSWKLLAFRVRVLGDMGNANHPMFTPMALNETPVNLKQPSVCLAYSFWGVGEQQNLCQKANIKIAEIPKSKIIAGWVPFNYQMKDYADKARSLYAVSCNQAGTPNWAMAVKWAAAYRLDVGNRKKIIRRLADLLVQGGPGDFQELDGKSILIGAKATFEKNLTRPNKGTGPKDAPTFEIFNSLGQQQSPVWLRDIQFYPHIPYTDFHNSVGCNGTIKPISGPGVMNLPIHYEDQKFDYDNKGWLASARNEPYPIWHDYHSSVGVEKNPWYMAYVGVRATTRPRKPFAPFGKPITLTARAFAKPFGGRIGPWYGSIWPVGADASEGDPIDPLLPPRSIFYDETPGPWETEKYTPNYSRYPGDQLGMRSLNALGLFRPQVLGGSFNIRQSHWFFLPVDLFSPKGDVLAWSDLDASNNLAAEPRLAGPPSRSLELTALAPDLFDLTYYSIEPNFDENYRKPALSVFGEGVQMRGDLGTRQTFNISVSQQVQNGAQLGGPSGFWLVKDPKLLLTSWAPAGANDYRFPEAQFGKCHDEAPLPVMVPGACANGGRTGYSVKIVSKKYLLSPELSLGGRDDIKGPISNPPPVDF